MPDRVAEFISRKLKLVTIGIGSGAGCDCQLLISHDIIGMQRSLKTRFAKSYADTWSIAVNAIKDYYKEVKGNSFPSKEHSFSIADDEFMKFQDNIG